jgi:hypothetical protein
MAEADHPAVPPPHVGPASRLQQRQWQELFADYAPVVLFAMAWAVIRTRRAGGTPGQAVR